MATQSPWFKFNVKEWLGGSIQYAGAEDKSIFIELICLYWDGWGPLEINKKLKLRLRVDEATLKERLSTLEELEVIKIVNNRIEISFLEIQIEEREEFIRKSSKGGRAKKAKGGTSHVEGTGKQLEIRNKKEEIRNKKEEIRNKKEEKPPCEFEKYWPKIRDTHKARQNKAQALSKWKTLIAESCKPLEIWNYFNAKFVDRECKGGHNYTKGFHTTAINAYDLQDWLANGAPVVLTKQERYEEQMRRIDEEDDYTGTIKEIII